MSATSSSSGNGGNEPISNHVYAGNLAWNVSWQDLKDHMKSSGGTILHADVFLDASGRSKRCGLVEFASVKDAADAILKLNDTELKGRKIFLRESKHIIKSASMESKFSLYVGNLDNKTKWQELKDHFKPVGGVLSANVVVGNDDTYGVVAFKTMNDAARAIEQLNQSNLNGRQITVQEITLKEDPGDQQE